MTPAPNHSNLLGSGRVEYNDSNRGLKVLVMNSSDREKLKPGFSYNVTNPTVNDGKGRPEDLKHHQELWFRAKEGEGAAADEATICYIWTWPKSEYFGLEMDYAIVQKVEPHQYTCWTVFRKSFTVPKRVKEQFLKDVSIKVQTRLQLTFDPFPTEQLIKVAHFDQDKCPDILYLDAGMITKFDSGKRDGFIVCEQLGNVYVAAATLSAELQNRRTSLLGTYVKVMAMRDTKCTSERHFAPHKAFEVKKISDEPPLEFYARCNFPLPPTERDIPSSYSGQGILVGLIGETAELAFKHGKASFSSAAIAKLSDQNGEPCVPEIAPLSTLLGATLWFRATKGRIETDWKCSKVALSKELL